MDGWNLLAGGAVVGMLADKDVAGVVAALSDAINGWYACSPDSPRSLSAHALAACIRRQVPEAQITQCDAPLQALEIALKHAADDDRIVAFGSFYTVAAVLTYARSRQ